MINRDKWKSHFEALTKTETLLAVILLLAFILRVYGVGSGLPYMYHSDENLVFDITLQTGQNVLTAHSLRPMNWRSYSESDHYELASFEYPTFHIYILILLFGILYLLGLWNVTPDEIMARSLQAEETILLYTVGRMLTVLMSVATVFIIYLIGKRLYSKRTGLLSALFLSITMMHARNSHWFTPDIPLTFWIVLSFYYVTFILDKDELRYYIYAGIAAGFAAGTKYFGFLIFIPILFAHILRENKSSRKRGFFSVVVDKKIIIALFVIIVVFIITTPYSVLAFNDFIYWRNYYWVRDKAPGGLFGFWKNTEVGWLYHIKTSLFYAMGLPLEILGIGGLLYALIKRGKSDILIFSWIVPYYLVIGSWTTKFIRYTIPIIPFLLIFGARAIDNVFVSYDKNKIIRRAIFFIVISVSLYSIFYSLLYLNVFAQEDVRTSANNWIDGNIESGSSIVVLRGFGHWSNPYINKSRYDVNEQSNTEDLIRCIVAECKGDHYLVVSSFNYINDIRHSGEYPESSRFYDDLLNERLGYTIVNKFEKHPNAFGYTLHDPNLPISLMETNPMITIFKKTR